MFTTSTIVPVVDFPYSILSAMKIKKTLTSSYRKQLKIEEVSRDVRVKKYTNKSSRDNNRQMHPYMVFVEIPMEFLCY